MPNSGVTPTIVCVHGAWHGPWAWDRTRRVLSDLDTVAVDLPSSGPDPAALGTLYDDAAVVRDTVDDIGGPVVVVAHSYGGVVATQALTECDNVTRIVFVTAFPLDYGESLYTAIGRQPLEWWDLHPGDDNETGDGNGRGYVDTRTPETFYTDCTAQQKADAIGRLTHQSWQSFRDPVTSVAWRHLPATYVVCTQDHALVPLAQSVLSARASDVRRLAASHSPMISQPDVLADLIRTQLDPTSRPNTNN